MLDRIDRELADPGAGPNLATVDRLFEAALYLGQLSRTVAAEHRDALQAVGADGTASFILGGQIAGEAPDVFLVYPEGNYIRASDEARIDEDSPHLAQLHDVWQRILLDAIGELPPVPSEVFTRQTLR